MQSGPEGYCHAVAALADLDGVVLSEASGEFAVSADAKGMEVTEQLVAIRVLERVSDEQEQGLIHYRIRYGAARLVQPWLEALVVKPRREALERQRTRR